VPPYDGRQGLMLLNPRKLPMPDAGGRTSSVKTWVLMCTDAKLDIIGKKLLSLKPVMRTRRSYNRAGLIKQQKSFQGLAMYGHEVFDVLTKASNVIRDTLFE
jgi:hypothetical protein